MEKPLRNGRFFYLQNLIYGNSITLRFVVILMDYLYIH